MVSTVSLSNSLIRCLPFWPRKVNITQGSFAFICLVSKPFDLLVPLLKMPCSNWYTSPIFHHTNNFQHLHELSGKFWYRKQDVQTDAIVQTSNFLTLQYFFPGIKRLGSLCPFGPELMLAGNLIIWVWVTWTSPDGLSLSSINNANPKIILKEAWR